MRTLSWYANGDPEVSRHAPGWGRYRDLGRLPAEHRLYQDEALKKPVAITRNGAPFGTPTSTRAKRL
ncbi:MAG: hypothetical protein KGJ72_12865 [Gammaproteobacteria bacterium]|nr:hypothetical protein [Gammaproteobacteria bacterium]